MNSIILQIKTALMLNTSDNNVPGIAPITKEKVRKVKVKKFFIEFLFSLSKAVKNN